MTNCIAVIEAVDETLDAGQRVAGLDVPTALFEGPAYLSGPTRGWQQAAAFEGQLSGSLLVHSRIALQSAARVTVTSHVLEGSYDVLSASESGTNWRLELRRRPAHAS